MWQLNNNELPDNPPTSRYGASAFRIGGKMGDAFVLDTQEQRADLPNPIAIGKITKIDFFDYDVICATPPNFKRVETPEGTEMGVSWPYSFSAYLHHQLPFSSDISMFAALERSSAGLILNLPVGFVVSAILSQGLILEGVGYTQDGETLTITDPNLSVGSDLEIQGTMTVSPPPSPLLSTALFYLPDQANISRVEWMGRVFSPLPSSRPQANFYIWNESKSRLLLFLEYGIFPDDLIDSSDRVYRTIQTNDLRS